jgi:hypothetical protein
MTWGEANVRAVLTRRLGKTIQVIAFVSLLDVPC